MTRARQIREALDLLAPAPDRRDECRRDVEHALDVMASTMRAVEVIKAERAAFRKTGRAYHRAFERLLAASKAHARAGGALAIKIARLEETIKFSTQWEAKVSRAMPKGAIAERQATALAYNLLRQWDRPTPTTSDGVWHNLAAILLGDPDANLFRHLREFKSSLR
jgi:hypothetical protein